ncbi:MAG: XdhC family protein [Chloroflexota bacterium]
MADETRAEVLATITDDVERALGGGIPIAVATVMDVGEQAGLEVGTKMMIRRDAVDSEVGSIDGGGAVDEQVREGAQSLFETFPRMALQILYIGTEHNVVTRRSQAKPGDARLMLELFEAPPQLVIAGGGHVGLAVATIAEIVGFDITIVDDRQEFANPERFPMAKNVIWGDFGEVFDAMDLGASHSIVLVSRGHQQDTIALRHTVQRGAGYIGMIGSQRRTGTVLQMLIDEGVPEAAVAKVHTPIGLDINAETPEEIALSILAEIVLVRKGGTGVKLSTIKGANARRNASATVG